MKNALRIGARSVVRHAREIHLAETYYKTHAKPFGYSSRFPPCLLRSGILKEINSKEKSFIFSQKLFPLKKSDSLFSCISLVSC
ncbi:hypothetical protein WN944_017307 [Citrus x changshan-huyou]|uniref:Uncharacterized protein n=1 Tax=Citrus x changshan-huyou TaxID=2935761 RepID=A0AAP0MCN5_9ROSI